MSDELPRLDYASPRPVVHGRNARASTSFWTSVCFPLLGFLTFFLGGFLAFSIELAFGHVLPEKVAAGLGLAAWGLCVCWPIPYALSNGIRAVREISRTGERGLWQAVVGIALSSAYAVVPLKAAGVFLWDLFR